MLSGVAERSTKEWKSSLGCRKGCDSVDMPGLVDAERELVVIVVVVIVVAVCSSTASQPLQAAVTVTLVVEAKLSILQGDCKLNEVRPCFVITFDSVTHS